MIPAWLFWGLLAAAFAALMSVFAKVGLRGVDPDAAQLARTAVVLPAMAVLVISTGAWRQMPDWTGRTWLYLVLSGLATGLSWVCYFRALDVGDASRVAAVDKLSVVIVAAVAASFLHERIGIQGWLGIALVTVGLVMLGQSK